MCGAVPVRASARGREMFVLCGWTGDDDWLGEIPAEDMPAVLNMLLRACTCVCVCVCVCVCMPAILNTLEARL